MPHVYAFEQARRCRICGCSQDRVPELGKRLRQGVNYTSCFDLVPVWRGGPQIVRSVCHFVSPALCSHCAEDGGPKHLQQHGPDDFSGLVDRFGEPLLMSKFLPRE